MKFAVDFTIMIKDKLATGNSKILDNFVSPFTATVVKNALDAGMELFAQTNTSEFSISNLVKDKEIDFDFMEVLSKRLCDVVFCNDFSGIVRRNISSIKGYFIQPTYGTVSRYGLIASMTSADQIGIASNDIDLGFEALSIISGYDENDGTSYPNENYSFDKDLVDIEKLRIGVPKNVPLSEEANKSIETLKQKGVSVVDFEIPYLAVLPQVQYIISSAEISNNTNRFDGIKYGYRAEDFRGLNELYTKTRTEGLGMDTKLASIVGALVLSADYYEKYYNKSLQIRRLFVEKMEENFKEFDIFILPQFFNDKTNYENFELTAPATLAGLPSLSLPNGVHFAANSFKEAVLYRIGFELGRGGKS